VNTIADVVNIWLMDSLTVEYDDSGYVGFI
jgi:hypothetical protein